MRSLIPTLFELLVAHQCDKLNALDSEMPKQEGIGCHFYSCCFCGSKIFVLTRTPRPSLLRTGKGLKDDRDREIVVMWPTMKCCLMRSRDVKQRFTADLSDDAHATMNTIPKTVQPSCFINGPKTVFIIVFAMSRSIGTRKTLSDHDNIQASLRIIGNPLVFDEKVLTPGTLVAPI